MITVYRYRVKSLNGMLNMQGRACNFVWNFCNDTQKHALKWGKKWPTGFDLNKLTSGTSKELQLNSGTINAVCEQYAKSRSQFKRAYLRYRGRRSLGWVPFKGRDLRREGNAFRFNGHTFRVFNSRALPEGKIRDGGGFSQDARGNWFINIAFETSEVAARTPLSAVGIDLGLKDFATFSTGEKIESQGIYRSLVGSLATAQRARKTKQARNINARIKNLRSDFLHKLSTRVVSEFDYIAVGNVSAVKLAKTKMAKSVHDASWSTFRTMLRYKAIAHGAWFEEVNEAHSTVTCSSCGVRSGPSGLKGLQVREWSCCECGAVHDRDVNAATNILLRSGHGSPIEGGRSARRQMSIQGAKHNG